jgi:4-amino-4-deoxy-L-arabinose transferase-like glycosyltransferase
MQESARAAQAYFSHWRVILAVQLVLAGGLFFWRLGERDLWSSHEGRAAMNARSLLAPDSNGMPRLDDGRPEVQKPPLYYWLVAGLARLLGSVDGVAVRLPAASAALATLAIVVAGMWLAGRPLAGLIAGLVLATSIHFPWLARIGRIDLPLTLTVTAAAGAFIWALSVRSRWRRLALAGAWLAVAAGVLLKGPIGLVLPVAIVAAFLLLEGRWPAFWEWNAWRALVREWGIVWGLALVALVCLPVFLWAERASDGQFVREFFWRHNVERGLGGASLRSHPWWLYGPYLGLYLLPFSPLLLLVAWPRLWWHDRLARLGLAWLVAVLLVLSAAQFKRADYLVPAYPGAALFLGCVIERGLGRWRRLLPVVAGLTGVMLVGWAVQIEHLLPAEEPDRDSRPFATVVRRHASPAGEVIFFRAELHALAFRVGRPLAVLVEWAELRDHLTRPGPHFVVMLPAVAEEAARVLPGFRFEELARTTTLGGGRRKYTLILVKVHAGHTHSARDRRPAPERGAAGP